jgi:subtilisin family serine protease
LNAFSVAASYDAFIGNLWHWGICTDATTGADAWACGTNAYETAFAKTDLVAPGALVTSTWPPTISPFTHAASLFGTSQATPQVVGCAALILEANAGDPTRTLADLESDLRTSPTSIVSVGASFGSYFPRLDCVAALPEPAAALQSLALFWGLAWAARRSAPSRQPSR